MMNWFQPSGRYGLMRRLVRWRFGPLYLLLFGLLLVLAGPTAHQGDLETWQAWTAHIYRRGLANTYENLAIDYNPLYPYILWLFGRLMGSAEAIRQHIHGLKAFTLLFDFGGAILAASLVRGAWPRFVASLWLLLNAGYLYDTLVWQQVDAIFTFFAFAAVVSALRQRPVLSAVLYLLALNAKLQAIIFLPPLLLLWLPLWRRDARQVLLALGAAAAAQVLLLAPYVWGGAQSALPRIIDINFTAVSIYPFISVNAYNVWVLLMRHALVWTSDTLVKLGLTYKQWGLLAFFGGSVVVLVPLLGAALRRALGRRTWSAADAPLVLLACGLVPLLFCFFNTEMHERYWHPAILFLGAYTIVTRRYWAYALASAGYFLNLQAVFNRYHELPLSWVHQPQLVAALFTLAILAGCWDMWRLVRKSAAGGATEF